MKLNSWQFRAQNMSYRTATGPTLAGGAYFVISDRILRIIRKWEGNEEERQKRA